MSLKHERSILWPVVLIGVPALLALLVGIVLVADASAQEWQRTDDDSWCGENKWGSKHCEIRETHLASRSVLRVDGKLNGGITVTGWSRDEIEVQAQIRVWGEDREAARRLAGKISIETDGTIRATGPKQRDSDSGWAVSYRIRVPHHTDLDLHTHNGGVSLEDVDGKIQFNALNGGISLTGLSGEVIGSTVNGGISLVLSGRGWDGEELDVETTNGGVDVHLPNDYSAEFAASTVNGSVVLDLDERVRVGRRTKRIRTTLGDGGAPIRVATVNGGLVVTQE